MKNIKTALDNTLEAGNFVKLPAGGYVVNILRVTDEADKEYLKFDYDIAEGEYKGFFKKQWDSDNRENKQWRGNFIRSYKESALPFFKGFCTACENSNKGFTFGGANEQEFKGKKVGIVVGYEEYINGMGKKRERLYLDQVHSVDKIKKGEFEIPELKTLTTNTSYVQPTKSDFVDPFATPTTTTSTEATTSTDSDPFANSDDNPFD
jgi:hypothetical protein